MPTILPGKTLPRTINRLAGLSLATGLTLLAATNATAVLFLDRSLFVPLQAVILKVEARLTNGRLFVGTGVTVAPGIVLTNCHVVSDAERITVSKRAGRFEAIAQHAAGKHDLCFLKVPKWRGQPIKVATSAKPRIHQPAAAIGYTGGAEMSFSEGRVSALYPYEDSHLVQTTSGFTSGASGGALLNEAAELIGILTFRLPGRSGHYYAVPASWISDDMPRPEDWQAIGSPIAVKPFWQGQIETLPYFMQVAPLEAQSRWRDLLTLSDAWRSSNPDSVEPLITKSRALTRLNRSREAIEILTEATTQDAQNSQAWFELAQLLSDNDQPDALPPIRQRLKTLDASLLKRLDTLLADASERKSNQ